MKTKNEKWVKLGQFMFENKAIFILLFFVVLLSFTTTTFLTSKNIINVIRQVSISGILSFGLTIIMASGNIDLSVGSMLSMIGVVVAMASKIEGMPLIGAYLIGILTGLLCGTLNATVSSYFNLAPFIVTLSFGQIYNGITYLISNGRPISGLRPELIFIGQGYLGRVPVPVVIMFVVGIILYLFLSFTKRGRHVLAVGGNVEAARVCGINVTKTKLIAYLIMGVCVAIGAIIMDGRVASAQLEAGLGMEMDALSAVVIGGTPLGGGYGNVLGTIIGCLIVGVINNGLNLTHVSAYWQIVAKGAITLFAIILDSQSQVILNRRNKSKAALGE